MTKRGYKYFKRKAEDKIRKRAFLEMRKLTEETFWEVGMMGSRVWLDESGKVQLKILSSNEILDMTSFESYNKDEYTIIKP